MLLPAVLSVLLPITILIAVADTGRSHAWPITLALMVWAGLRLSQRCLAGEPRFFDFFFWLYVYLFLGLAPTIQLRADALVDHDPGHGPGPGRAHRRPRGDRGGLLRGRASSSGGARNRHLAEMWRCPRPIGPPSTRPAHVASAG